MALPPITPDDSEHDRCYKQAIELMQGEMILHDRSTAALGQSDRKQVGNAIPLLKRVIELNPQNWSAMWVLGKAHQRLGEFDVSFGWFARSHAIKPDHPDVAREATIAALEAGRPQDAIPFARRAIESSPDDAGLRANLALALLFSGAPGQADEVAREALAGNPSDEITKRIVSLIEDVVSGKWKCPRHVREI